MSTFTIDFFELAFLAEACIPPVPIARYSFFMDLCNKHYHNMTQDERDKLFEWIQKSPKFDLEQEQCHYFYARFNKDNQYNVQTEFEGKTGWNECFIHNGKYSINERTWIPEEYIIKTEKL